MLNSFEVAETLQELGFTLDKDNTHGWGFIGPTANERVYVKTPKKKYRDIDMSIDSPVAEQPLVLIRSLLENTSTAAAVERTDASANKLYKNHNLTWLDRAHKKTGIALNIASRPQLRLLMESCGYVSSNNTPLKDIEQANPTLPANNTEREAVVQARIGQGPYRRGLEQLWSASCSVTGVKHASLLRASHAKPWRDSDNIERLDPNNGLLLIATLDAAFDSGLISFQDNGRILLSPQITKEDALASGIHNDLALSSEPSVEQQAYLQHHRDHIFRK